MSSTSPQVRKRSHEPDIIDDPQDTINAIISALTIPAERTNVADTYANDKNLATEVQAYAKIAGADWTYYVKSLAISIGRNTDVVAAAAAASATSNSNTSYVDIDLGPAKVVSRQHATITYNLDLQCWQLKVLGRNGAKIDGNKINPNTDHGLHSGAILDIGGTQMMFILPDSPAVIAPKMLERGLAKYKEMQSVQPHKKSVSIKNFQMFDKVSLTQSPSSVSATSLQTNLDQDLSKEESKDIKPPYSYATMITQAILSNPEGIMSLSEIYNWIASHYAYYKYSKAGWQNSIRHNLSLNKAFEKVPRRPNEPGKGMKWQISQSYKQDFLNKINDGTISKARRGSSVSRQLHLHLATHKHLPEPRYYENIQQQQQQHQQLPPRQSIIQQQVPPQQQQQQQIPPQYVPTNPMQSNPLSYMSGMTGQPMYQPIPPQQQPQQAPPPPAQQSAQRYYNNQPIMYAQPPPPPPPPSQQPQQQQQQPQQQYSMVNSKELASPLRQQVQLQQPSIDQPKLPKVGVSASAGPAMYSLPPPPAPTTNLSSAPAAHSRSNSYGTTANSTDLSSKPEQSSAPSELSLNFTSPKKISALEAYTPERGSKARGGAGGVINNGTNQSSPAFWNFVQFSTPNGQSPLRKDEPGSPTLNRKNNGFKQDDSPTKKDNVLV
ncbi:uncharacterized protein SPAPADRAFT_141274 [Spathaspora passalidarum NRRL Y-27907]|uniref:Transcription factor n=1 Tax=Spathaspora passalidarum (strain NRRL Y-27907 / 11-Y1) TaxID=619300 RepID=G3ARH9_SPAPN|nr:uncharacterized protein SPAPADRAFT_141274 [Spathaspora passalidarum NRRL Y-27907]EGW31300.1 hypothetical protein SPAPADRAFT_141274 [Spathaspora passalidarum NRRL Y-27907]